MNDDVLEQLSRANPVPEVMAALPIASVLALLDEEAGAASPAIRRRGGRRLIWALPYVLSVAVVIAAAGVVLTIGGHRRLAGSQSRSATSPLRHRPRPSPRPRARASVPSAVRPRLDAGQIVRANARDTPLQLFESKALLSLKGGTQVTRGGPIRPYSETLIRSSVRELGTFSLSGVGLVQYWSARTRQHGLCTGLRLPTGVWVGLSRNSVDGSAPGCQPTRAQVGAGALIIDGFDYGTSGLIGHEGQRWLLAWGAVSVPQRATRVRDTRSGIDAAIVKDNYFVLATHPVGNDYGDDIHLEGFDASGQRIAIQNKALPRAARRGSP